MTLNDILSKERTYLANERTLLAYFRCTIVLLSSGIAILKLSWLEEIQGLGFAFVIIAPIVMLLGFYRFYRTKKRISNYYNEIILNDHVKH